MIANQSCKIAWIFAGKSEKRWPGKPPSAIAKKPIEGSVWIDRLGLEGDEQADLSVHGGLEKAIHHYALDHHEYWKSLYPADADRFAPGCFGENIGTHGVTENDLCVGDVIELGGAAVQICQGRQPCWKLNAHLGLEHMAAHFKKSGRTGWYYRVLRPGRIAVGDTLRVVDRPYPDWTLQRIIAAMFSTQPSAEATSEILQIAALSEEWTKAFTKKLARTPNA